MAAAAELVEDLGKIFGGRNGGRNSGGWWVLGKCGHKGSMVKLSLWMIYMRVIPLNNGGEANIFRGLWDVMWIFAVSSVQFIHLGCIILGVPLIWTTPKYTHTYVQVYIYIHIYIYLHTYDAVYITSMLISHNPKRNHQKAIKKTNLPGSTYRWISRHSRWSEWSEGGWLVTKSSTGTVVDRIFAFGKPRKCVVGRMSWAVRFRSEGCFADSQLITTYKRLKGKNNQEWTKGKKNKQK